MVIERTIPIIKPDSIEENAVQGSESPDIAKAEIACFFKPEEVCERSR